MRSSERPDHHTIARMKKLWRTGKYTRAELGKIFFLSEHYIGKLVMGIKRKKFMPVPKARSGKRWRTHGRVFGIPGRGD